MLNNLALPLAQIEERLRATIASSHLDSHMSDVYEILRAVGVVDRSIVGDYFDRCLDLLQNDPGEVKRLAVRYSTLFNIYTGFYKNRDFERRVTELIAESLVETTIPRDFADYLSVYLSFNSRLTEVGGRKEMLRTPVPWSPLFFGSGLSLFCGSGSWSQKDQDDLQKGRENNPLFEDLFLPES
jgi:hypothetical protein